MDVDTIQKAVNEDRDPDKNNDFVKVGYSDVICEPTAIAIPERLHQFIKTIYGSTICVTYWLLTIVFGGFLSFIYGLLFGVLNFSMIWVATPITRASFIPMRLAGKIWLNIIECVFDPWHDSIGRIFSRIKINFKNTTIQHV
ncbi:caveolin-1-like [Stylophora pistillata]|uniref:Caveolin n=1 Tax=Stylophora pistillata TaxID=50429 RepID=A0A2B4SAZ9_STYPI|nr:caveolin-1-like [Stylophora pistillata]PFX27061.1 Caveolin-1 [Stylophora pistillata]